MKPKEVTICFRGVIKFYRILYQENGEEYNFYGNKEDILLTDWDKELHSIAQKMSQKSYKEIRGVMIKIIKLTLDKSRHSHIPGVQSCTLPYDKFMEVMNNVS